jgi:hypothetical protein
MLEEGLIKKVGVIVVEVEVYQHGINYLSGIEPCNVVMNSRSTSSMGVSLSAEGPSLQNRFLCTHPAAEITDFLASQTLRRIFAMSKVRC